MLTGAPFISLAILFYLPTHSVLRLLLETVDDRIQVLEEGGLRTLQVAFNTVYMMHHEATACHVAEDMCHLLGIVVALLKAVREKFHDKQVEAEVKARAQQWKERPELMSKLLTLLSSYQPPDVRQASFGEYPSFPLPDLAPLPSQTWLHM